MISKSLNDLFLRMIIGDKQTKCMAVGVRDYVLSHNTTQAEPKVNQKDVLCMLCLSPDIKYFTIIDFNFGRHKDLSAQRGEYHFIG